MSNSTSYSKLGYLGFKKETTCGVAVQPDVFAEIQDESIQTMYNLQPVEPIAGRRDARLRTVKDKITVEGSVNLFVDAKTIGYFLEGLLGEATTTTLTASTMFQHVFTSQESIETYTFDVKKAGYDYIFRYFGVHLAKGAFSQSDNKIMTALDIQAMGSFTSARVTADAVQTAVQIFVDQTKGITTDDTVQFLDKDDHSTVVAESTVTAIVSETEITVSAVSAAVDALDIMVIKKGTATYDIGENMIFVGGSDYLVGSKDPYPVDNTSTINAEDFTFEFENELDVRHAATGCDFADRFPSAINTKAFRASGSFTKFYETIAQYEDLRNNQVIGTRMNSCGATLDTNSAVAATATIGSGTDGVVTITSDTAGRADEDINIKVNVAVDDTLTAVLSGNNITVSLANSTTSKNTATLVAGVIDALSGVGAASSGTGATEFAIAALDKINLGDVISGRDATEKENLRISYPNTQYEVFGADLTEDDIINQEIPFIGNYDEDDDKETVRVVLRNGVSSY